MRIRLKESRQIMMACMIKWRQLCKPRGSQVITLIWSCRKYSICRIFSTDPPIPTVIRKESDFWFTKSKFKSVFGIPVLTHSFLCRPIFFVLLCKTGLVECVRIHYLCDHLYWLRIWWCVCILHCIPILSFHPLKIDHLPIP